MVYVAELKKKKQKKKRLLSIFFSKQTLTITDVVSLTTQFLYEFSFALVVPNK